MSAAEYLTFENLRYSNLHRCEKHFHPIDDWSPTDWGCAIGGEVGEALNMIKKLRRLQDGNVKEFSNQEEQHYVEEIMKELADTVIYADLLATRLDRKLSDYIVQKFDEVSDRVGSEIKLG